MLVVHRGNLPVFLVRLHFKCVFLTSGISHFMLFQLCIQVCVVGMKVLVSWVYESLFSGFDLREVRWMFSGRF